MFKWQILTRAHAVFVLMKYLHSPTSRKLNKAIVCQVLRTLSKSPTLCRLLVPQDTPKTTKRKGLFFRDPPIDSVRVRYKHEN